MLPRDSALASVGSVLEPAGTSSVWYWGSFWNLLTEASVDPPLPKPCHLNPIQATLKWGFVILYYCFNKISLGGVKDKHLEKQTSVEEWNKETNLFFLSPPWPLEGELPDRLWNQGWNEGQQWLDWQNMLALRYPGFLFVTYLCLLKLDDGTLSTVFRTRN